MQVDTAAETFFRRLVPGIEREWRGADAEDIEDLEIRAAQELPEFYRWFLTTMGGYAGALDAQLAPFYARSVLSLYEEGLAASEPPLLLIARMDDPLIPVDLYYDLSRRNGHDARILRGFSDEGYATETLREWLGWVVLIARRINPMPQRCEGTFHDESGKGAAALLASFLPILGFESSLPTGPYCALYERADMALAAKIDIERGSKSLLAFDLGGAGCGLAAALAGRDPAAHRSRRERRRVGAPVTALKGARQSSRP